MTSPRSATRSSRSRANAAADLVVVAPDDPLALGLVDVLEAAGIAAFGPTKAAARIEASKSFAKDLMRRHGIPMGEIARFDDFDAARALRRVAASATSS